MSQDLDQILLLIGAILGAGFAFPFLMAWLEPSRPEAAAAPGDLPGRSRVRLMLARRVVGPTELPAAEVAEAA